MKEVELLAPAGSMEALYAAIQNGCDAVYLGGPGFGARAFANNFTREELVEAIHYAHIYGVRVFITVNTLIDEDDLSLVCDYIRFLQDADADALIIQDLGLLSLVLHQFPDMEVHASTQMHVHNEEGIKFLKQQGVARVVVPRETSLEEIRAYAKLGVDLEVFVQGALCVSYSGQCLMSSALFGRSGNKGACAQPCRMQYELIKEQHGSQQVIHTAGDYLLSPKDLNTLESIGELMDAGVASCKIEGRMKRPEYVAYMVSLYRKAIDAHKNHQHFKVTRDMQENMEKLFHRGFTKGHIFHQMGSALMNPYRPNHMGVEIGKVIAIQKDKMIISLSKELMQGDGIRILSGDIDEGFRVNRIYRKGLLVNRAVNEEIALDRIRGIKAGASVLKTSDALQLKQLQQTYHGYQRKVGIEGSFVMIKAEPAIFTIWDDADHSVSVQSEFVVETARTTALCEDRIRSQLSKTKDSPFVISNMIISMDDDVTMPISELNRMRREAIALLINQREIRNHNRKELCGEMKLNHMLKTKGIHVIVHTEEQYETLRNAPVHIYCANMALYQKLKAKGETVGYRNSRVRKQVLIEGIANDIGALSSELCTIYDTGCNVCNHMAGEFLFSHGAQLVILSLEVGKIEACTIAEHHGNYGYVVYGKRELMISEHCVIHTMEKNRDKQQCGLCKQASYFLEDKKHRRYPLLCDEACRMHILEEHAYNRIEDIPEIEDVIHHFVCVFTNENADVVQTVMQQILTEVKQ